MRNDDKWSSWRGTESAVQIAISKIENKEFVKSTI